MCARSQHPQQPQRSTCAEAGHYVRSASRRTTWGTASSSGARPPSLRCEPLPACFVRARASATDVCLSNAGLCSGPQLGLDYLRVAQAHAAPLSQARSCPRVACCSRAAAAARDRHASQHAIGCRRAAAVLVRSCCLPSPRAAVCSLARHRLHPRAQQPARGCACLRGSERRLCMHPTVAGGAAR